MLQVALFMFDNDVCLLGEPVMNEAGEEDMRVHVFEGPEEGEADMHYGFLLASYGREELSFVERCAEVAARAPRLMPAAWAEGANAQEVTTQMKAEGLIDGPVATGFVHTVGGSYPVIVLNGPKAQELFEAAPFLKKDGFALGLGAMGVLRELRDDQLLHFDGFNTFSRAALHIDVRSFPEIISAAMQATVAASYALDNLARIALGASFKLVSIDEELKNDKLSQTDKDLLRAARDFLLPYMKKDAPPVSPAKPPKPKLPPNIYLTDFSAN